MVQNCGNCVNEHSKCEKNIRIINKMQLLMSFSQVQCFDVKNLQGFECFSLFTVWGRRQKCRFLFIAKQEYTYIHTKRKRKKKWHWLH